MEKLTKTTIGICCSLTLALLVTVACEDDKGYSMPEKMGEWRPGLMPSGAGAGGGGGRPSREKASADGEADPKEKAEGEEATSEEKSETKSDEKAETATAAKAGEELSKATLSRMNVGAASATLSADDVKQTEAESTFLERPNKEWAMWGGAPDRNMVNSTTGITLDFDLEEKRVLWTAPLGSQTYGNPIYADGKVFVGTNNGGGYRAKYPSDQDKGILLCFDAKDGGFLWQLTRDKMPSGRVNDWPLQGICSAPVIEGNRMWVVTNKCEVMCLDVNGFTDGENTGDTGEVDTEQEDADIIWTLDMYEDLGVFPHNLATSSPVIHGDILYLVTSNGVDEAHLEVPSPRAPCFLGINKNTGEVVFVANPPEDRILHGQWSSPCVGEVDGKTQIIFPGGDGWMYAYDSQSHELIWKFDLNPKNTTWELGGAGTRNSIIGTPVFYQDSVIIAVGQDPEHGEGVGHLWRIDATKTGDISTELGEIGVEGSPNPNAGAIWHYGGVDEDDEPVYRRTMSTVAIYGGMLFASDLSGFVHCIDFETGKRYWQHDLMAAIWGSPLYVDGNVMIGDEDGRLTIFDASKEYALKRQKIDAEVAELKKQMRASEDDEEVKKLRAQSKELIASVAPESRESPSGSSIYTTPTIASGVMYISDRSKLYAIQATKQ